MSKPITRRAFLSVESLEGRQLLSASPVHLLSAHSFPVAAHVTPPVLASASPYIVWGPKKHVKGAHLGGDDVYHGTVYKDDGAGGKTDVGEATETHHLGDSDTGVEESWDFEITVVSGGVGTAWGYHLNKNGDLTHLKKVQGDKAEEWDLNCGKWIKREWDAKKEQWGGWYQQPPGTVPPQDYPKGK